MIKLFLADIDGCLSEPYRAFDLDGFAQLRALAGRAEADPAHPRLGLAVSRKKLKTAVSRNLVKRLIRESFRHHSESLGSLDLVVMPQGGIAAGDRRRLRESLENHFRKVSKCRSS